MAHDIDGVLHEYLLLKDEVDLLKDEIERQRRVIEELSRPRHWTQAGPRGAQAAAVHHALDKVLEAAVKVRDVGKPGRSTSSLAAAQAPAAPSAEPAPDGCYSRLRQAADLLGVVPSDDSAFGAFLRSVAASERPTSELAWLGFVAVHGRYPIASEFDKVHRALRSGGPADFRELLETQHRTVIAIGATRPNALAIRPGAAIIDVTHTATHDLHTGIQRVVREAASRWVQRSGATLVWWDERLEFLRELGDVETYRFREWMRFLPEDAGSEPVVRQFFDATPDAILVPWDGVFVLPELAAHPRRSTCYASLIRSGVVKRSGAIGFDLVPLTSAETVHEGMVAVFPRHISVVKHMDRVSAISESAASEYRGLWSGLGAQGIPAPDVEAHALPPTPVDPGEEVVEQIRADFDVDGLPVVLVVGSREPRKNQITILEATQVLWDAGHRFHLVMVGGSGWDAEDVNDEIDRLRALGVAITVRTRAGEAELFAWYRIARFSIFPSLHEGFGLPIVESLGVGTPVITSNYGSTAEVAALGGTVLVDPRDPVDVERAMESLLTDDELVSKLENEAAKRSWPSWDGYANDVWSYLLGATSVPSCDRD